MKWKPFVITSLLIISLVWSVLYFDIIQVTEIIPTNLPFISQRSHLGTLTISGTTELCGNYDNVWDVVYVTSTGVLNICAFNGTANTGFVNLTLGTAGNFTVEPGGVINGSARGATGGIGCSAANCNATQGTNGNNWTTGANTSLANGGGGGAANRTANTQSAGGGGGGFGGAGAIGGKQPNTFPPHAGVGGNTYGAAAGLTLFSGSGGGGGASDTAARFGGNGGAGFKVNVGKGAIKIEGVVNVTGGTGLGGAGQDEGAGGGGSGGHIILHGAVINLSGGILNASGGIGGSATGTTDSCAGGGGGGGRIYLVYSTLDNTSATTSTALGQSGTQIQCDTVPGNATAGTITHNLTAATFTDNAPQWITSSPSTNNSNPAVNAFVRHNVNWTDDGELSFATLEVNGTGAGCDTAANVTSNVIIGTSNWSNLTWQIPAACSGKTIGWRIYVKDFPNNQTNVTALQSYQVQEQQDTCTYGGSGNWNILCSDNCNITSNVNLGGNNITLDGNGLVTLTANISNWRVGRSSGQCTIRAANGGGFKA